MAHVRSHSIIENAASLCNYIFVLSLVTLCFQLCTSSLSARAQSTARALSIYLSISLMFCGTSTAVTDAAAAAAAVVTMSLPPTSLPPHLLVFCMHSKPNHTTPLSLSLTKYCSFRITSTVFSIHTCLTLAVCSLLLFTSLWSFFIMYSYHRFERRHYIEINIAAGCYCTYTQHTLHSTCDI